MDVKEGGRGKVDVKEGGRGKVDVKEGGRGTRKYLSSLISRYIYSSRSELVQVILHI